MNNLKIISLQVLLLITESATGGTSLRAVMESGERGCHFSLGHGRYPYGCPLDNSAKLINTHV